MEIIVFSMNKITMDVIVGMQLGLKVDLSLFLYWKVHKCAQ